MGWWLNNENRSTYGDTTSTASSRKIPAGRFFSHRGPGSVGSGRLAGVIITPGEGRSARIHRIAISGTTAIFV
jgi:hypothetical protein